MIPKLLREFREIGGTLGGSSTVSTLKAYYSIELGALKPDLTYVSDKAVQVPLVEGRTGIGSNPRHLQDNLVYILPAINPAHHAAWWGLFLEDLVAIGDPELVELAKISQKAVRGWVVQACDQPDYYYVLPARASTKNLSQVTTKKPEKAIADRAYLGGVPWVWHHQGKPLFALTKVRNWWKKKTKGSEKANGFDLVTGQPCVVERLHRKVKEFNVPFVSFQGTSTSFTYEGAVQALNFPISPETNAYYTAGLEALFADRVLFSNKHKDKFKDILLLWGRASSEASLVTVRKVLRQGGTAWDELEQLPINDEFVNVVVLKPSTGRLTLLAYEETTVERLRQNLLAFRAVFGAWSVYHALALSYRPKVPAIPATQYIPTLLAILLGTEMPGEVSLTLADLIPTIPEANFPLLMLWMQYTTTQGNRMFDEDEGLPGYLSGELGENAYTYGVLLALFYGSKRVYHKGDPKPAKALNIITAGLTSPRIWFGDHVTLAQIYQDTSQEKNLPELKVFASQFAEVAQKLGQWASNTVFLNPRAKADVAAGWLHAKLYVDGVFAARRKRRQEAKEAAEALANEGGADE